MSVSRVAQLAIVIGVLGASNVASFAQLPASGGVSFVGETAGTPQCPAVGLHIVRQGNALSGVVFYLDGSGMSTIQGQISGVNFNWSQKSASGNGPPGHVRGSVVNGLFHAHLEGTTCSFTTNLQPIGRTHGAGG